MLQKFWCIILYPDQIGQSMVKNVLDKVRIVFQGFRNN